MDEKILKVLEEIRDFQKEAFAKTEARQDVVMENQKRIMEYNEKVMAQRKKMRPLVILLVVLWIAWMLYITFF